MPKDFVPVPLSELKTLPMENFMMTNFQKEGIQQMHQFIKFNP